MWIYKPKFLINFHHFLTLSPFFTFSAKRNTFWQIIINFKAELI